MKSKLIIWLLAATLSAACVPQGRIQMSRCNTQTIPLNCVDVATNPVLKIHNVRKPRVTPPNRCVHAGDTIEFTIDPAPAGLNSVGVYPKNQMHLWLTGVNDVDIDKIRIDVPASIPSDKDYDYSVVFADNRCLDPRIRVEN